MNLGVLADALLDEGHGVCSRVDFSAFQDATILITGASGLIGSNFVATLRALLDSKKCALTAYCIVHSEPGPHFAALVKHPAFHLLSVDLSDYSQYHQIPAADLVIHAAGYAQPDRFMNAPVDTVAVNAFATLGLLGKLKQDGRLLFLSSTELYCGLQGRTCSENDIGTSTPFHPRAAYIEGKRCGETICYSYFLRGVHAVSARLGDVFGPGTRRSDERSINAFIRKAISNGVIDLKDRGSAIRTFCYVSDVVEMLWKIVLFGKQPIYNIGGQAATSIADVACRIARITGARVVFPQQDSGVTGAPLGLAIDQSRFFSEFSKDTFVSLNTGLEKTIAWQRRLYA
jgi:UDP-glucuronate decarboxylase